MKLTLDTLFIGRNYLYFDEIHSTNDYAIQLIAEKDVPEGTVIMAHNQKKGKGQIQKKWFSDPGKNITLSIVLKPKKLQIKDQFSLAMLTALSIVDLVKVYDLKVKVKWPNDIYLANKKLAGILIQNQLKAQTIDSTVIGIGLNVNQVNFPINTATSLALASNQNFDIPFVTSKLLSKLEARYLQGLSYFKLRKQYEKYLLGIDQTCFWRETKTQNIIKGTIKGIDNIGKLIVLDDSHLLRYFNHGEISLISHF